MLQIQENLTRTAPLQWWHGHFWTCTLNLATRNPHFMIAAICLQKRCLELKSWKILCSTLTVRDKWDQYRLLSLPLDSDIRFKQWHSESVIGKRKPELEVFSCLMALEYHTTNGWLYSYVTKNKTHGQTSIWIAFIAHRMVETENDSKLTPELKIRLHRLRARKTSDWVNNAFDQSRASRGF